jgi:uncharacterized protein (TIGR00299 family) protein
VKKILYLQCSMGAAGDMLTAALFELIDDKDGFLQKINSLGLDGVKITAQKTQKCAINGTLMNVSIDGQEEIAKDFDIEAEHHHSHHDETHKHKGHHGSGFADIEKILLSFPISQKSKDNALSIYKIIAEAESKVHNRPVEQIHFHEIGQKDAIADITAVCLLMEILDCNEIIASPINVGSGFVHCAHGILPVPAPASALILQGIPIYSSQIKGELCTPTGAAILKHFVQYFEPLPQMTIEKIGYGMGKKDFDIANCIRAFYGVGNNSRQRHSGMTQGGGHSGTMQGGEHSEMANGDNDEIAQLSCNLDDMTGEAVGFASEILLKNGALDVFTIPIYMKKTRPAFLLECLCPIDKADFFAALMLKHTTSFGIRKTVCQRYILERKISQKDSDLGKIKVKTGQGYGVKKSKAEYEDIAKAALSRNLSFDEASKIV